MTDSSIRTDGRFRSFAVVSGKGGSGKTLVAAAWAHALAAEGRKVVLVDADLGTGGLTYYLGFSTFERAREGLSEYLRGKASAARVARPNAEVTTRMPAMSRVALLPVGEHRLIDGKGGAIPIAAIERLNTKWKTEFDVAIYDCRGGLDQDSIAVCKAADDVILVAETDAASIQASQFLSQTLYDAGLGRKIAGFMLNKVMDDPSSLAKAGTSFFRCDYLGAIPFDIETTRGFIRGAIPPGDSLFSRHVAVSLLPMFGVQGVEAKFRPLSAEQFSTITLTNPDERLGIMYFAIAILYMDLIYFVLPRFSKEASDILTSSRSSDLFIIIISMFGLGALSARARQFAGRVFRIFFPFIRLAGRR